MYAILPKLLERSGMSDKGSITGFYTTLVEGDDMNDPVADTVRSILDGHLVLSRKLAAKNQYPAIDVLQSVSRLMSDIADEKHKQNAARVRDVLATYSDSEDLINIGAYVRGSNPRIDFSLDHINKVQSHLGQKINEKVSYGNSLQSLHSLFQK